MNIPIPMLNIFSIFPYPKGWTLSSFFLESFAPISENASVKRSEIAWMPDATKDTEWPKIPDKVSMVIIKTFTINPFDISFM